MPEGVLFVGGLCRHTESDVGNRAAAAVRKVVQPVGKHGNGAGKRTRGYLCRRKEQVYRHAHPRRKIAVCQTYLLRPGVFIVAYKKFD